VGDEDRISQRQAKRAWRHDQLFRAHFRFTLRFGRAQSLAEEEAAPSIV
jgi:hypothetical protein